MSRSARATVVTLALGTAAGLTAGCGGAGSVQSLRPTGPIAKAEATAYANNVNLGVADVPGWVSISPEREETPGTGRAEARCAGEANPDRRVVWIHAPFFMRKGGRVSVENVSSDVRIRPTAALVAQDFVAARRSFARPCERRLAARVLEATFARALARVGGNTTRLRFGQLVVSAPPSAARPDAMPSSVIYGERAVLPVNYMGRARRWYVDVYTFHVGRAEISLDTESEVHPVATATDRDLLALLYRRAKT